MTRINVGIDPAELCDQHLIAEYRELPRVIGHAPKGYTPDAFCLGRGHVNWCALYQGSLQVRHMCLCIEMWHRGFNARRAPYVEGYAWTAADEDAARPIVRARICERLATMRRVPRWTNRSMPGWAITALRS